MSKTTANTKSARSILIRQKLSKLHWGRRIIRAEKSLGFTLKDFFDAQNWETCACGKASNPVAMQKDGTKGPLDTRLRTYGDKFSDAVGKDDFICAARVLVSIERRAAKFR